MNTNHRQSSLKDSVYQSILEDILAREYCPGDILTEKVLVEKYKCSKTPVREALVALCNDQILRNLPRYGYEVIRLSSDDVQDMLQFRFVLESGIVSANLQYFTKDRIELLEKLDEKCTKAKEQNNLWLHWDSNANFHIHMLSFCNNVYAVDELRKCMNRLKRAYAQLNWDSPNGTILFQDPENHAPIIESIRKRDKESLLIALKNDLNGF